MKKRSRRGWSHIGNRCAKAKRRALERTEMPTAGGISAMQWGITFVYASFIADIPDCAVVSARFARAA
ncbi:hypothetical protein KNG_03630 [Burkholderia pseudomallei]|nr:hypothetical protein KNG_03630 [Burkholderia pseudomallei]